MCVDAHIPSSSCQALVLAVRNVFVAIWINILLCKTKVNYKYRIPFRAGRAANEEILWLDITIDKQLGVNILHTLNLQQIQRHLLIFSVLTASLLWITDLHGNGGNPTESAGMATIVAGIQRGWNKDLWKYLSLIHI